jgi:polyhydroxyalkanoate synthesis regulator phasin
MNRRTRRLAVGVAALGAGTILIAPIAAVAQSDDPEDSTSTTVPDTTAGTAPGSTTDEDAPATNEQDKDPASVDKSEWLQETLQPLIDDGTITQEQADAVIGAIQDAGPPLGRFDGPGRHGHGPLGAIIGRSLETAAEAIGITTEELRDALADGQTLAEIAQTNGVDAQTVIDALVAEATQRLDEAVANGRLDQAEADELLAELTEHITMFVNEGMPARPDVDELPRHRGPSDDQDATDDTEAPTTTTG